MPLLPTEARWDASTQALTLDGTRAGLGDSVGLGGGELNNELADTSSLVDDAPDGCDTTNVWLTGSIHL